MIHEIEPDRYDPVFYDKKAVLEDYALAYSGNKVLAYVENGLVRLPKFETLADLIKDQEKRDEVLSNAYYLFSISGKSYFLAEPDLSGTMEMKSKEELLEAIHDRDLGASSEKQFFVMNIHRFRQLLPLKEAKPEEDFHGKRSESVSMIFAASTGGHIAWWKNSRKYCGCCGALAIPSRTERAMNCPVCGNIEYPKISPAIIVAVIKKTSVENGTEEDKEKTGDRLLLVRNKTGPYKKLALVAGFVEIGESFEQAVHREVMEEVGLRVKNLRYYKNQPWGLTYAQMIGFTAELEGDDRITLQESELTEADWYLREDIPDDPFRLSVGNEMIHEFKRGNLK